MEKETDIVPYSGRRGRIPWPSRIDVGLGDDVIEVGSPDDPQVKLEESMAETIRRGVPAQYVVGRDGNLREVPMRGYGESETDAFANAMIILVGGSTVIAALYLIGEAAVRYLSK